MKLVSYKKDKTIRAGILNGEVVIDIEYGAGQLEMTLPPSLLSLLERWEEYYPLLLKLNESINKEEIKEKSVPAGSVSLQAPLPDPRSIRDAYAFRQHVETARRNRGVEMIPEFDQFPVFYFTNSLAVFGEGDIFVEKDHLDRLDFELECAIVIGKAGRNIKAAEADEYIAGYMVYNDLSARQLQKEEMKLNLGPAKGKDFANIFGPALITKEELEAERIPGSKGDRYDLTMRAYHNDSLISEGNLKDMNWTFGEIIERASYGVTIQPGEIIGSGTVGTGCYLELNGSRALEAKKKNEEYKPVWLREDDRIELEIDKLGKLETVIKKQPGDRAILRRDA